ncbi:MAG: hypothetical protein QG608_1607 [Actinomycetota bacterium]|nr:hypothetical protein [Actinomycetota bacterium]
MTNSPWDAGGVRVSPPHRQDAVRPAVQTSRCHP